MYRDHTIGVVVPAYNEEGYVGEVVETLPAYVDRAYVIDDGSSDETWTEIRTAADAYNAEHPSVAFDRRVVPLQHTENRGVGAAVRTGYQHAHADQMAITVVMSGDGQMDPDVLTSLLDPIVEGTADYTKGNRFFTSENLDATPQFRQVENIVLSALTKVASGYWSIGDSQNGYTAISLAALEAVDVDGMYGYDGYCNDLLVRLNVAGMRVADVAHPATSMYYGEEQRSHSSDTSAILGVSWLLFRLLLWRLAQLLSRRPAHPVVLSYSVGAGLVAASPLAAIGGAGISWLPVLALGVWLLTTGGLLDHQRSRSYTSRIVDADEPPYARTPDPPLDRDGPPVEDD